MVYVTRRGSIRMTTNGFGRRSCGGMAGDARRVVECATLRSTTRNFVVEAAMIPKRT